MKTKWMVVLSLAAALVTGIAYANGVAFEPSQFGLLTGAAMAGMINAKASEKIAVVATIDPQTVANTELFSDPINMANFHQAMGIALLGNMAAETIDFKAYTCDSGGNNAVALRSATQLAAHASNNDNKQIVINVRAEEVLDSTYTYVKFGLVTGNTTGGPAAVVGLGVDPRELPITSADLSTVVEIKQ